LNDRYWIASPAATSRIVATIGTVAHHQRHGCERSRGRRAERDVACLRGVQRAGFLDRERDTRFDQEAGLVGHVAVAAEHESKVRV
jgi:hypothetical protein